MEWIPPKDPKEREEWRQRIVVRNLRDAAPVVSDLQEAGFSVPTIASLYNFRLNYARAIPVLLKWLPKIDNPHVKASIVRALAVKWARPQAGKPLIEASHNTPAEYSELRWAIGNSISIVADDSLWDEVSAIAQDPQFGSARMGFAEALGNMRNKQAGEVLRGLLHDPEGLVVVGALVGLQRLKDCPALEDVQALLEHPDSGVRKYAKRTFTTLQRASAKL